MNCTEEIEPFQDDTTDRDETTAIRAALDGMDLVKVDEGPWWKSDKEEA